jgi:hypothetical protein
MAICMILPYYSFQLAYQAILEDLCIESDRLSVRKKTKDVFFKNLLRQIIVGT